MGHYRVEIDGVGTFTVEAADQIAAEKTARRRSGEDPPMFTYTTEIDE